MLMSKVPVQQNETNLISNTLVEVTCDNFLHSKITRDYVLYRYMITHGYEIYPIMFCI